MFGKIAEKTEQFQQQRAERNAAQQRADEEAAFWASPVGQARQSYQRGDAIFQTNLNVQETCGHTAIRERIDVTNHDVSGVLSAILAEGWDLHSFSTTFVHESEKLNNTGDIRPTVVSGTVLGTYLFRRRQ